MIFVDSNIFFDVWEPDPVWSAWSSSQLRKQSSLDELAVNPIVYAELSVTFATAAALDEKLEEMGVRVVGIPRVAAFLAGKAFIHYRRQGGTKANVLPDFFVGAHAQALGCPLLTRDTRRYTAYFPSQGKRILILHPEESQEVVVVPGGL